MGLLADSFLALMNLIWGSPEEVGGIIGWLIQFIKDMWSSLEIFSSIFGYVLQGLYFFTGNFWFFVMIIELFIIGASIFTQKTDSTSKAYTYIYNYCFYHIAIFNMFFIFLRGLYKLTTSIITAIGNMIPTT